MTSILLCAALALGGTGASFAQNSDSITTTQLEEVIVKANPTHLHAGGITFVPTTRQKASAQNGIDLLRRMAMPQVKVGLATDNVTTSTGDPIAIYINYTKSTPEELEGLRTAEVRKVEFYYSPTDQRFLGDRNVVNIIVQPYEYGGYTKLSMDEKFLVGISNNNSLYSKFAYRKMTYDVFISSKNYRNTHTFIESESRYKLSDINRDSIWITRIQEPNESLYSQNILPISFRASLTAKRFQMKHTLSFTLQHTPRNMMDGVLSCSPTILPDQVFSTAGSSRAHMLSYTGNLNFTFPSQIYLTLSPKATFGHTRQDYSYSSPETDIRNVASDDSYATSIIAMGRKTIKDVHFLFLRGFGGYSNYEVCYSGSTLSKDRICESYYGASVQYGYYTEKIAADMLIGIRS